MITTTARQIARGEMISLVVSSFSVGTFLLNATNHFARDDALAWLFTACAIVNCAVTFVLARRTLRRIPDNQ